MGVFWLVIGIVASIGAVQAVVWFFAIRWMRRRAVVTVDAVAAGLVAAGERIVRGPESATYRGGSGSFSRVKSRGVLALSERQMVFSYLSQRAADRPIRVPLDELVAVRQERWFQGAATGGRMHLVLRLADGDEVAFFVADIEVWIGLLQQALA